MALIEGNKDNFKDNTASGTVLLDFHADWCGPCQMLRPTLEELADSVPETILSINIDDEPELAERFSVEGIPCLVALKDGKEVSRSVGVLPLKKLIKLLESAR